MPNYFRMSRAALIFAHFTPLVIATFALSPSALFAGEKPSVKNQISPLSSPITKTPPPLSSTTKTPPPLSPAEQFLRTAPLKLADFTFGAVDKRECESLIKQTPPKKRLPCSETDV